MSVQNTYNLCVELFNHENIYLFMKYMYIFSFIYLEFVYFMKYLDSKISYYYLYLRKKNCTRKNKSYFMPILGHEMSHVDIYLKFMIKIQQSFRRIRQKIIN